MKMTTEKVAFERVIARFSDADLKRLLTKAVCEKLGVSTSGFTVAMGIEQETEGSPAYSVRRWTAAVTLIYDKGSIPVTEVSP